MFNIFLFFLFYQLCKDILLQIKKIKFLTVKYRQIKYIFYKTYLLCIYNYFYFVL